MMTADVTSLRCLLAKEVIQDTLKETYILKSTLDKTKLLRYSKLIVIAESGCSDNTNSYYCEAIQKNKIANNQTTLATSDKGEVVFQSCTLSVSQVLLEVPNNITLTQN